MNKTAATNAVTIPSTMIATTTPAITYTMDPDSLSMLISLLVRRDTGWMFVALVPSTDSETFWGIEVTPSSETSVDINAIPSSEASGGIEVIPSFEASGGIEVISVTSGIEVKPSSASDEVSTVTIGIMVVWFLASDELVQVARAPKSD